MAKKKVVESPVVKLSAEDFSVDAPVPVLHLHRVTMVDKVELTAVSALRNHINSKLRDTWPMNTLSVATVGPNVVEVRSSAPAEDVHGELERLVSEFAEKFPGRM